MRNLTKHIILSILALGCAPLEGIPDFGQQVSHPSTLICQVAYYAIQVDITYCNKGVLDNFSTLQEIDVIVSGYKNPGLQDVLLHKDDPRLIFDAKLTGSLQLSDIDFQLPSPNKTQQGWLTLEIRGAGGVTRVCYQRQNGNFGNLYKVKGIAVTPNKRCDQTPAIVTAPCEISLNGATTIELLVHSPQITGNPFLETTFTIKKPRPIKPLDQSTGLLLNDAP